MLVKKDQQCVELMCSSKNSFIVLIFFTLNIKDTPFVRLITSNFKLRKALILDKITKDQKVIHTSQEKLGKNQTFLMVLSNSIEANENDFNFTKDRAMSKINRTLKNEEEISEEIIKTTEVMRQLSGDQIFSISVEIAELLRQSKLEGELINELSKIEKVSSDVKLLVNKVSQQVRKLKTRSLEERDKLIGLLIE